MIRLDTALIGWNMCPAGDHHKLQTGPCRAVRSPLLVHTLSSHIPTWLELMKTIDLSFPNF